MLIGDKNKQNKKNQKKYNLTHNIQNFNPAKKVTRLGDG